MQAVSVKDLSRQRAPPSIILRVVQIWENWSQEKSLYELGLLLLDYQGNTIEGCVGQDRITSFKDKLDEGLVYKFESFMIANQKLNKRASDHPHRIRLARLTKVTKIVPQPEDFPSYTYNIKAFDELQKIAGKNDYVSDVIGVAIKQTDLLPSNTGQDPRRQIRIKNGDGKLAIITLWGKHAEDFEAQQLYEESIDHNMVVLFTGVTVTNFLGLLAFSSTSLTRYLFNPPIPEVEALHNSIEGQHYMVEWDGHGAAPAEPSESTLNALGNQELDEIISNKYRLNILITEVKEPERWWFYACKNCWKGMVPYGNGRRCPTCGKTEFQQRYKLCVDAIDIDRSQDDKVVTGRFMFYGEDAQSIVGKELSLLLAQAKNKTNFVPPAITATVGKKCVVVAKVKDDTYNVDEEGLIVLEVKKAEMIKQAPLAQASSSKADQPTSKDSLAPEVLSHQADTANKSDINAANTPPRDAIDQYGNNTEKESLSPTDIKKRKITNSAGINTTKKGSSSQKEGRAGKKLSFDGGQ